MAPSIPRHLGSAPSSTYFVSLSTLSTLSASQQPQAHHEVFHFHPRRCALRSHHRRGRACARRSALVQSTFFPQGLTVNIRSVCGGHIQVDQLDHVRRRQGGDRALVQDEPGRACVGRACFG
jgi:hypothetical protein